MKVDAFFFDLDGTLVDTEACWSNAIVDFLSSRGAEATREEILPNIIGRNWLDINSFLHRRYPEIGKSSVHEDAVALRGYYSRYAADKDSMVIRPAVEFLRVVSGIAPCAIVSGSPHDDIVAATELCGISENLSLILGAGEYEEGKPSPSGYLKAAALLGANPSRSVVVEDSTVGVASGVAAGMNVLAVSRPVEVPQDFTGAKWVVEDLSSFNWRKAFS
jgi:sugar-phosphatase